ncbi:sulfurtransferase TusA family protein [Parasedimentitalea maritima]|uniref:sulfurtransferase TusA family protein n=1 Tax=Parasedimentitalea maritima TaxID=2578117 RepID=UPI003F67BE36
MNYPSYLTVMNEISETLDAIGLLCPLPVLKARKRLKPLPIGAVLQLLSDDPAAVIDVPHFCNETGHTFLGMSDADGHQAYLIRKGV